MTATATPATVARRTGMFSGVLGGPRLDSPGARLHTDDDELTPAGLRRELDAAIRNERAAQALANTALLDLAVTQAEVKEVRQLLLDMTVRHDAVVAELESHRPLHDVVADDFRRGALSPNLREAWRARGDR